MHALLKHAPEATASFRDRGGHASSRQSGIVTLPVLVVLLAVATLGVRLTTTDVTAAPAAEGDPYIEWHDWSAARPEATKELLKVPVGDNANDRGCG
jgi:hypothetical protein